MACGLERMEELWMQRMDVRAMGLDAWRLGTVAMGTYMSQLHCDWSNDCCACCF